MSLGSLKENFVLGSFPLGNVEIRGFWSFITTRFGNSLGSIASAPLNRLKGSEDIQVYGLCLKFRGRTFTGRAISELSKSVLYTIKQYPN